ncbi:MAG TPA: hypothetical protein VG144_14220 [Gaiellaceae bacterium]|jgi:hypothetical protein|nr:hypothetical protein [Gaiellaceae bacterium]
MGWEVRPRVEEKDVERALLIAVARALADEEPVEPAWWRSGFDDLRGDAAPQQTWREAGVVES